MKLTLKIWRQKEYERGGTIRQLPGRRRDADMSFLEILDVLTSS